MIESEKRGPGFWRFNTSLLTDQVYVEKIRNLLRDCKDRYQNTENKHIAWDSIKCEIRSETISYACYKAKINRELECKLNKNLENLAIQLAENPNEEIKQQYDQTKVELDLFISQATKGAMIRSRAQWAEVGEKNNKYFLNLEKRNSKMKI